MKINKNWEPKLVTCTRCEKDFNDTRREYNG